ncbi:MAG: hypothetical protein ACKVZH_16140 [Blastocatellia bacterium]
MPYPEPAWRIATESKLKHLEMIQAVITRMANNSFLVKGWCLTLVSGLLALAGGKDGNTKLVFVTYLPLLMFWYLDGFFLQQERLFRKIYDYHRQQPETDFAISPADIPEDQKTVDDVVRVMRSKTLLAFYGMTLIAVVIATCILNDTIRNGLKSFFA